MTKYVKKPVVIDAIQWNGDNFIAIDNFITIKHETYPSQGIIKIPTLEGTMTASVGDFIIKGIDGEFYPCKPEIFNKTYDIVYHDTDSIKAKVSDCKGGNQHE